MGLVTLASVVTKTRDGTGRDSAGISRPVPGTKIRDETSVTARPRMLVLAREIQFLEQF